MRFSRGIAVLFTAAMLAPNSRAEVRLPKVFSDHMVIQRERPIHIWGLADPGEQVAVQLQRQHASAVADEVGRWSIYLEPMEAGGPYTLSVQGKNVIQLNDILLGDIWIASGQSNMEMPLSGFPPQAYVQDAAAEIKSANYPQIRLMRVDKNSSLYPLEDFKSATPWQICAPETVKDFSAVAYFFGRDLQKSEKVPIGLVAATWNGTPVVSWISMDALSADASLMPAFAVRAVEMDAEETANDQDAANKIAVAEGKPKISKWHPSLESGQPAGLFNAMIAPLTPMAIRGVIWYQGEADGSPLKALLYERLFPTLINDWREQWHTGEFPFLFVQLAAWNEGPGDGWPTVRDAQRDALKLVNTGMAVAIDVGDEKNLHPANKQAVGERLSLLARNVAYGEAVESSGPVFRQAVPMDGGIRVWFDHAEGLHAKGDVQEFEIAGADKVFVPATATIEGETILAKSDACKAPLYVRYAWKSFPHDPDLYNGSGLPAATFTSLRAVER
jgi:sialate O-acetylesterase